MQELLSGTGQPKPGCKAQLPPVRSGGDVSIGRRPVSANAEGRVDAFARRLQAIRKEQGSSGAARPAPLPAGGRGGGPARSLDPAIDRLAGIFLAVAVFWLVDVLVGAAGRTRE